MRILHIDSGREMRGGQRQVLYLLEGLARQGHDIALLAPARAPLSAAARDQDIECRPVSLAAIARLARKFDLVHAHDARSHTLAAAVAARVPLVVSRRVAFPLQRNLLSAWKYAAPARFIAVSDFVKNRLTSDGIDPEKISVVYDGVPLPAPARPGARIVAPATEDPRKGSALLREAAAAGGFAVHFSTRLLEDLADAALFVYITKEEGLGSAVLLAMASGVPVVASRVGGVPEAVADGETGLLVDNTPGEISAAVRRLGCDAGLRARFGAAGRRRAEALFSAEAMVRGTLQVYHRVLA